MTNLSRCTGLSFLLLFICSIRCEDENYFENLADPDDLVNPHSFSYDKQSKSMVDNTLKSIESAFSKDYTKEQEDEKKDCKCVKNVDNSDGQVALFYKRLINMMLLNMHIKGDDVLLVGTLEIIMTPSELEILKNFGTQRSSIKEIDEILSAAMKMPNNRLEKITDFIAAVFERLGNVFRTVSNHPDVLLILGILFATLATLRMIRHGHARVILILAVVIFVQSFLMTWWRLIKEEEAKNMAEQMKFSNVPKSCQPDKMTLWDKFVTNLFGSNECEKYYEAMMSNPKLKVTPLYALTHLCSTVMLQPIVHIGTVISDFINNATDALPWQYGWLIRSLLYLAVCIVIIMLPLCLMGGSVDLGFGPLFKFAIGFHKRRGPGARREHGHPIECTSCDERSEYNGRFGRRCAGYNECAGYGETAGRRAIDTIRGVRR
ncbi:uncharacterized protein LOC144476821 isoform X2 [Augochlora pura]